MTVDEALWVRLRNLDPVTAITGRIYLEKLPQSPTYPAVLVFLVDDNLTYHLRGPNGNQRARVQVDALVQERSGLDARTAVENLADAIIGSGLGPNASGLSGFTGLVGASGGIDIRGCFLQSKMRRYEGDELRVLTRMMDFQVGYRLT